MATAKPQPDAVVQRMSHKRLFAAIALCAVSIPLVAAISVSTALRTRAPDLAITIWPWNDEARGQLASRKLIAGDITSAHQLSLDAVRSIPGDAVALRVLGASEEARGAPDRALRLLNLAGQASRRDLLTNMWFIEYHVRKGDIPGAIHYYDLSLKSSADSEQILFPILTSAMSEPDIAKAVSEKLALRPIWTISFLQYAFSSGAADSQLVPIVLNLAAKPPGLPVSLKRQYAQNLAERGNFEGLAALARGLGAPITAGPGKLEGFGSLPPADWQLLSAPGMSTFAMPGSGVNFVAGGSNAPMIERIVHLSPGTYALRMTANLAGGATDAKLRWTISCAPGGQALAVNAIGNAIRFDVPTEACPYQRLSLAVESDRLAEGGEVSGDVTHIGLDRIR